MKCANNDDSVTLRAQDNSDTINFVFESPSKKGNDFVCIISITQMETKLHNLK